MMIDRSSMDISLLKIFGYNKHEIRQIYFGSAAATVIISLILSLWIGTFVVKRIFPFLVSGVDVHIPEYLALSTQIEILLFMLVIFGVIQLCLRRRVNRIPMADIIRDRD
jgi:putative ABC transport system permease protein